MRALYVSTLALFIAVFGIFYLFRIAMTGATVEPQVLGDSVSSVDAPVDPSIALMINEINNVRSGVGVDEFSYNNELQGLTDYRVQDMVSREYYSHKTPDGFTYANNIPEFYPESSYSCENLQLQVGNNIAEAVSAWVNSPAHYRCLVNPRVSNVAISYTVHGKSIAINSNQSQQMYVFALIASN